MNLRVLTWNVQALFPVAPSSRKWKYLTGVMRPHVALLTEATAPPGAGGYRVYIRDGGIDANRRWGTAVAVASHLEAVPVAEARWRRRAWPIDRGWPGTVVACDILSAGERILTAIAAYALTIDLDGNSVGHGRITLPVLAADLRPLLEDRSWSRVLIGGDFNAWPSDVRPILERYLPLVDLIDATSHLRPGVTACQCADPKPCPHIWTHRNKAKPDGYQQIDYLLGTPDIADAVVSLRGGPGDFPGIWNLSDHAPIEATLDLDRGATPGRRRRSPLFGRGR